jgi:hypothetical protein
MKTNPPPTKAAINNHLRGNFAAGKMPEQIAAILDDIMVHHVNSSI